MIRVGLQTISWGPRIDNLELLVHQVRDLGYEGLEFSQPVGSLPSPDHLSEILTTGSLIPIGLAGGSLESRIEYAERLRPEYLYTDTWDELPVRRALDRGFTVALHPHAFKDLDTVASARPYLEQFPELALILDTAHLFLTDDDIIRALQQYSPRVVAVHLKDWTSRFGKTPFRFSRGFTALGKGELSQLLEATLDCLLRINYDRWIVVEQDTPHGSPIDCARLSRNWLRDRGF